jgi:hypothetical protein
LGVAADTPKNIDNLELLKAMYYHAAEIHAQFWMDKSLLKEGWMRRYLLVSWQWSALLGVEYESSTPGVAQSPKSCKTHVSQGFRRGTGSHSLTQAGPNYKNTSQLLPLH